MNSKEKLIHQLIILGFIFTLSSCQMPNHFDSSVVQSSFYSSSNSDSSQISIDTSQASIESEPSNSASFISDLSSVDSITTSLNESSETPSVSSTWIETSLVSSNQTSSLESASSLPTYEGYYSSLEGKTNQQLFPTLSSLLRSILTGSTNLLPSQINYGNARYDIPKFDKDPNNSSHVILVYSQSSVNGAWDGGSTWNREHVFPQSLMGVDTTNTSRHKGADYHNLKPENPSVNSSRGNKYFSESTTSTTFAPPSNVRGDIARILFYMVTMWPELSLVDVVSGDPVTYTIGQLTLFVKWHLEDPVDTFEANRNEVIYGLQGNRNPYVDHQELVCRIWGTTNSSTIGYCGA